VQSCREVLRIPSHSLSVLRHGKNQAKRKGRCSQSVHHPFGCCQKATMLIGGLPSTLHTKRCVLQSQASRQVSNFISGIFPREPRHKKRANKGSSAPTSFYYSKDIAYLAHEPVLKKLREHKAFAKKLARALGRGEWSSAKSLEDNRPVYTLDHIVKER
jgi:hypothetical protein